MSIPHLDGAEAARLAELDSYAILDSPAEQGYDDLALLASMICRAPVSLVSLVGRERQWFKANIGFNACETPLSQSVCAHGMHRPGLLIIPDLADDPRTADNTLVTEDPKIRFYAGARLETPGGQAVGMLCVIDTEPRPGGLTADQAAALEALARQVMTLMELRRLAAVQAEDLASRRRAEERQRFLLDLSDLLSGQAGPRARMQAAVDALGRFLGASRVGYGMILDDGLTVSLETEFVDGVAVLAGVYPLDMFGPANIATLKAGRTSIYADVEADPDMAGLGLPQHGIAALVAVPQVHEHRLRSIIYVNQGVPRAWRPDEVAVIEDVANRIWDAVERARTDDTLRLMNETLEAQVAERTRERDRVWQVSQDMLGVADFDGKWLSVNPAWQRTLGWQDGEIIGRSCDWLRHPDDVEKTRAERARLNSGLTTEGFENRLRTSSGDYRLLSWRAVPVGNRHYCVARDITEERELAARQAQVEDALRQSQKLEAIGQLTGGVAHDFNNLLTVIKSASDLLKRPGLTEARRTRYIDGISDTVDRAARLTGQLLAFARRQALKPEIVDVARNVRAMAEMIGTLTGARIAIKLDLPDAPCCVNADSSQLDTALVNICVNARDAMQGEGLLAVTVRPVEAIPATGSNEAVAGGFIAIAIADTGSGIPADQAARIFEPFYTTKPMGEGTGLGLSQVFGFVKQSGGEVLVESAVGRGTVFTLYLPRAGDRLPDGQAAAAGAAPLDGGGLRVLLVEDNRDVGGFTRSMLDDLGYRTHLVTNADDALAGLARDPLAFDVVFTDVVMPGRDGVALAREIARLYPALPVVLTSGYSSVLADDAAHGFDVLHKPYSVEGLSKVLCRAVAARRRDDLNRAIDRGETLG